MLDADQIKVRLIDFLLEQEGGSLIASEVPFYQGYRKADLVYLANNSVTAFEIKSDRDSLSKLSEQVRDYSDTFSFCYLVTTEKHIRNARKLIPSKTGIIIIDKNSIHISRKPKENKRLSKHSLTLALSGQKIQKLITSRHRNSSICSKRSYVEQQVPMQFLQESFFEALIEKYQKKYENFLVDRGLKTTLTDLYYLQSTY